MIEIKTFEDAIRFAIREEQNAIDYYLDLATQVVNFESKTVLEQLARDEMRHREILYSILENKNFKIESKSLATLNQLVFEDEEIETGSVQSNFSVILTIAIRREIYAAKMYNHLASTCQNTEVSQLLIVIAEEELKHKKSLELELEYYSKPK